MQVSMIKINKASKPQLQMRIFTQQCR
ncbi:hypothetical protein YPPY14_1013, partial [Yersinia pestis PY-14]